MQAVFGKMSLLLIVMAVALNQVIVGATTAPCPLGQAMCSVAGCYDPGLGQSCCNGTAICTGSTISAQSTVYTSQQRISTSTATISLDPVASTVTETNPTGAPTSVYSAPDVATIPTTPVAGASTSSCVISTQTIFTTTTMVTTAPGSTVTATSIVSTGIASSTLTITNGTATSVVPSSLPATDTATYPANTTFTPPPPPATTPLGTTTGPSGIIVTPSTGATTTPATGTSYTTTTPLIPSYTPGSIGTKCDVANFLSVMVVLVVTMAII